MAGMLTCFGAGGSGNASTPSGPAGAGNSFL